MRWPRRVGCTQTLRMCQTSACWAAMRYPRTSRRLHRHQAHPGRPSSDRNIAPRPRRGVGRRSIARPGGGRPGACPGRSAGAGGRPRGRGRSRGRRLGQARAAVDLGVGQPRVDRHRRRAGAAGDPADQVGRAQAARGEPGRERAHERPAQRRAAAATPSPPTQAGPPSRARRELGGQDGGRCAAGAMTASSAPPGPAR